MCHIIMPACVVLVKIKFHSFSSHLFFFQIPPSLNMLRIQAGEQEKSEIYIFFFSVLGATQCIRTVMSAKELVISKKWNNAKSGYCS